MCFVPWIAMTRFLFSMVLSPIDSRDFFLLRCVQLLCSIDSRVSSYVWCSIDSRVSFSGRYLFLGMEAESFVLWSVLLIPLIAESRFMCCVPLTAETRFLLCMVLSRSYSRESFYVLCSIDSRDSFSMFHVPISD